MTDWKKSFLTECREKFPTYEDMIKVCTSGNLIFNNEIIEKYASIYGDCEVYCGSDYDEEAEEYEEVFQYYIIDGSSADFIAEYTDELAYELPEFYMYLLGVKHWGTPWSGVVANWKDAQ